MRLLGRDYWLYQFGQAVSVIGDGCSAIALAWWTLDKTGSPAKMGGILAVSVLARVAARPLLGPLGDKFPRKNLIIIGDISRAVLTAGLAAMVWSGYFNMAAVIAVFTLLGLGSALFGAGAGAIVPQLVPSHKLRDAVQYAMAVSSGGSIAGGLIGGILVSATGAGGAFAVDALSFLAAAAATFMIRADTTPKGAPSGWLADFREGIRAIWKIKILFWMLALAAFLNFTFAPVMVALPVMVKQARGLPAWFYGGLNSAMSAGIIIGSLAVGRICAKLQQDRAIVAGIVFMGAGIALLPYAPGLALPLALMAFQGFGSALANIPTEAHIAIATPDEMRARVNSVIASVAEGMMPLGMALSGVFIERFGYSAALFCCGIAFALLAPALYLVPDFKRFYRLPPAEAEKFFKETYPEAFAKTE
ncbi:MAG: MFS transporter [Elusimicrobiales bacterium]